MEKLVKIQCELQALKNQHNDFGGYDYRSCEDILNGLKPFLKELKLVLILQDSIEVFDDDTTIVDSKENKTLTCKKRVYIKATAKLIDEDKTVIAESSAYAREEVVKKGMDASQITGASSSYARKYALCGLFAIDDGNDPDKTNKYKKDVNENKPADNGNGNNASNFKKPTLDEVAQYLMEKKYTSFSAKSFYDRYENAGWKIKDKYIDNWKSLADWWNKQNINKQ